MDESEGPAAPRFTKSLMELLGDPLDKPQGLEQVRLINRQKHAFIHEFDRPLPPEWQWAAPALNKLHKEMEAGSPSELMNQFISNGGEVAIVQGRDCNNFYEYAGQKHRDKLSRVAFVSQYQFTGESSSHPAIVLMEANYTAHRGSMTPEHGERFFHNSNTLLHELGHAADIRTGPSAKLETRFTGRHSESALFNVTLKLDRLFNPNASLDQYVDTKLSRDYNSISSRSHEKLAIISENYHSNKKPSLGSLVQTYFKSVLIPDMALRAEGNTAAMDKLANGLDKPPYAEIFGGKLGQAIEAWLKHENLNGVDNNAKLILANKDLVTSRLTDYLASAIKIANNAASRSWSPART